MTVIITLTTAGTDTGPFNLYSNLDGYVTAFATGIDKNLLLAGYSLALVPDFTEIVRVKSTGDCLNYVDIPVNAIPPTTLIPPTTIIPQYWYRLYRCEDTLTYYAGPFIGPQDYGIGLRVEGATATYYIVIGTTSTQPADALNGITAAGSGTIYGCP